MRPAPGHRSAVNHDKPGKRVGRVIVNLNLEAISNNVSALPVSPLARPVLGQRGAGGFAATLAAAQGLSSASSAASETAAAEKIAGSTATGSLSAKGAQNAQPKKSLSSAPSTGANTILGVTKSVVVPEYVALQAGAIAGLSSQMSQVPTQSEAGSIRTSGGAGKVVSSLAAIDPGLSPSPNAQAGGLASASVSQPGAGVLRPTAGAFVLSEIIPPTVPPATAVPDAPSGQPAVPALPPAMGSPAPIPRNVPQVAEAHSDPTSSIPALSSTAAQRADGNRDASQLPLPATSTPPALFAENAKPEALYTTELAAPDTAGANPVPNLNAELKANSVQAVIPQAEPKPAAPEILPTRNSVLPAYGSQPDELTLDAQGSAGQTAGQTDSLSADPAQSTPQLSQAQATVESAPVAGSLILLADASGEAGPEAGMQSSPIGDTSANPSANLNADQEDGAQAGLAAVAPQPNAATPTEIGNLFSGISSAPHVASPILNSQISGSQVLSSQAPAAAGRAAVRAGASKGNAGATSSPAGAGLKASTILQPGSTSETEPGTGSQAASQTPFSVFFSSSGSGSTESAASTLPKMVLPATTVTSHGGSTGGPSGSSINLQSVGSPSSSLQSAGPQPMRDWLTGTPTGSATGSGTGSATANAAVSSQTAQLLHSDSTAATASAVVAQVATTAGQGSAPVVVLAAGQATVSGDSAPKPEILPAATTGNPAAAAAAAVPASPTLVPGPVQMAQMVNRVGQSEMRVGMNTSAFGNVEVRTVVHASDVGLTIGSEKGDLRGMLANEMPAIANTLQQQNLRLNNVNFMQGFGAPNHGFGGGDSQPRSFVPPAASENYGSPSAAAPEDSGEVLPPELRSAGNSFSILA